MAAKAVSAYKAKDYQYSVGWSEEDGAYVARVTEFPSLSAHGSTLEAALKEIQSVVAFVLKELVNNQEEIPEPLSKREFSGRFNVRIPKDLHRNLAMQATQQGVSLNQLVCAKLAK